MSKKHILLLLSTACLGFPALALGQIVPGYITLGSLQQQQFTLTGYSQDVLWSVEPTTGMGTITQTGLYTAPNTSTFSSEGVAFIYAQAPGGQNFITLVYLMPGPAPGGGSGSGTGSPVTEPTPVSSTANGFAPLNISISLSPASVSLQAGQSATFTATVQGTYNEYVEWSLSPNLGTIVNGVYTAPSSVVSDTQVTILATSEADSTKTASASVLLEPVSNPASPETVSISLSPASASLTGGQSATFTPTVTGTSNTAVTWSLSPQVGTITNGVYQAPATIASQQTITITATSAADSAETATATVSLTPVAVTVGPATVSLAAGQSATFTASVTGTSNTAVTWSLNPAVGTIVSGVYTAPPTIASSQTVTVTAASVADPTKTTTATVTLTVTPASNPSSSTVTLPVEVMGAVPTTVSVSVNIPSGSNVSGQLQLWLQIHGLEYQSQASVQVNAGAWMPINDTTATYLGHSATFGGIGGGFATLQLTMNLPAGSVQIGQNTLTFQFNGTDGNSSGFRVLNFNVLASNGSQLIPQSAFVQDDPSTWTPPLNDAADIQAGQTLWKTASLTSPTLGAIQATCGSCHTQDGRDLKYFNYSNNSIEVRSMFHGLTAQQGAQIASYIRSLNVPAPSSAAPWNPPYQPGPGLDSLPVSEWAAGAGLSAVLDYDADTLSYVMPGGSTANLQYNAFLNQRETPIDLQLRDWNHWLPTVYPLDAFGTQFSNSGLLSGYSLIRSELIPNNAASYAQYYLDIILQWLTNQNNLFAAVLQPPTSSAWNSPLYDQEIYSVAQWLMVKSWEINQEYGLEGMPQAAFGPQAESRAWYTNQAFLTSPFMLKIPRPAPGIGNGSVIATVYDSFIWYHLQLILNDGNGTALGTWPIDRGYSLSYLYNDLTWDSANTEPRVGTAGLMMEWLAKILQSGIDPGDASPYFMVLFPGQVSTWSELPAAQTVQLMNTWVSTWTTFVQSLSSQQLFTAPSGITPPATTTFSSLQPGSFTGDLSWALPLLNYEGVNPSLLNQVATWASGYWPTYNWLSDITQACTTGNYGEFFCN